ncbi:Cyclic di-GMP phosphodiesterase response regulator RpfG [Baekduia alba]|uniref:HD-GYP domain-containing protein n=1 Tax=Baekduia alba TaxID=2997333 RepID=UPI0023401AFD|nr:HD-GYP domain-containing protein [Baekduia alba]WCB92016.1 Cyclic di-GMP phosphodiesterase response regulator RpfG [Baekduia alba]
MPGKGTTTDVSVLQERLATVERSAAEKEQQLERYAADLRETFKRERERRHELRRSYMATVRALCNAVEARDAYTGKHAERVAAYGMEIAKVLDAPFSEDPEVEFGFLLHDVGKVAVPDSILWKPEPLTPEERTLMERHPLVGWEILREIEFLGEAKLVVRHHHERWDGAGYPDGLAGELIPLSARVFAVADVLDALTTVRPYRAPSEIVEARAMIRECSGTQFDPEVVDAFLEITPERLARIQVEVGDA